MAFVTKTKGSFSVKAYRGDAKTLLAFNLDKKSVKNLAGFTLECEPDGQPAYYILNELQFKNPGDHAQDAAEPANSSINAPIHNSAGCTCPGPHTRACSRFLANTTIL